MNFIIGIVAVGESYIRRTKDLIDQLLLLNTKFVILTNDVDAFKHSNCIEQGRIITIKYDRPIFSFHDKRLIFEEGFKYSDCVLLLDADHVVRENNNLSALEDIPLEPGIYPQILWKHPCDCSFESFIQGLTPRVPYGLEFKQRCNELGLETDGAILFQESFLLIKKHDNIDHFLSIWKDLAAFCEQKDIERRQGILGYGEGYSVGMAVKNSGLKLIEDHPAMHQLARNLQHVAWEPK